jgi:hypothetical protein
VTNAKLGRHARREDARLWLDGVDHARDRKAKNAVSAALPARPDRSRNGRFDWLGGGRPNSFWPMFWPYAAAVPAPDPAFGEIYQTDATALKIVTGPLPFSPAMPTFASSRNITVTTAAG